MGKASCICAFAGISSLHLAVHPDNQHMFVCGSFDAVVQHTPGRLSGIPDVS